MRKASKLRKGIDWRKQKKLRIAHANPKEILMDEHMQRVPDPRDAQNVDLDAINNAFHYALYAVFRLADPLPADADARRLLIAESAECVDGAAVTALSEGWNVKSTAAGLLTDLISLAHGMPPFQGPGATVDPTAVNATLPGTANTSSNR